MKKNRFKMLFSFITMVLLMVGCENNLEIMLPQGPKGEQGDKGDKGDKGDPGMSAFDLWIEVNGKDPGTPVEDFFNSMKGKDGEDGKSAYELWKDAVDKDEMTNKDGSDYTGGNTWEDFLIWLQGGDVSVLHRYWLTLPGNTGKTIEEFINELFDCHCDGIIVSVFYTDDCMEQNPDGTLNRTYNAQLRVGGPGGTQVQVTGQGVDLSGTISDDTTPVVFTIPSTEEDIPLTIACVQSGNTIMKHAVIPALQLIKLASIPSSIQVPGEQKDIVTIEFEISPAELLVDEEVIYDSNGITEGSGWAVSNEGRIFTRTYVRSSVEQKPTVRAINSNGVCTTIEEAFTIPPLTPVEFEEISLVILDDCFLTLSFEGTPGMTVKAMNESDHNAYVMLTEGPDGTYSTSEVPRTYEAFTIRVRAEKEGRGTVEKLIEVEGSNLTPIAEPLTISMLVGEEDSLDNVLVKRRFTNNTAAPLTVTATRGNNSSAGSLLHPMALGFPRSAVIPANDYIDADFFRDYTEKLGSGKYVITFVTRTECGLDKTYTLTIHNLQNYRYAFRLLDGWGDGSGNPADLVTFEVSVVDALPSSYVELQLFNGVGYAGVSRIQLDENGSYTWNVTMTRAQVQAALDNVQGFFLFFSDSGYINKYNIGADKEEIIFQYAP